MVDEKANIIFHTDRTKESPRAVAELLLAVGWKNDITPDYIERIERSWTFHDTLVFAKFEDRLVGYGSAYSDLAFTTGMGELIVHPEFRRKGIAKEILGIIEKAYPALPFYIKTFADNEAFFNNCGFKTRSNMIVLSKVTSALE